MPSVLWITFKSCIFAFWNNVLYVRLYSTDVVNYIQILYLCILKQLALGSYCFLRVVNYIQILYLCILKQQQLGKSFRWLCCELHSNLVSLHSETTIVLWEVMILSLWITFKSCIFAFWNNQLPEYYKRKIVVNYIQILYLCILKQPDGSELVVVKSCELHSNLVSLHSETTMLYAEVHQHMLWITFKSCIFAFWNNK